MSEACQSKGDFLLDPGRSLYSVKAQVVKLFLFELMQSTHFSQQVSHVICFMDSLTFMLNMFCDINSSGAI